MGESTIQRVVVFGVTGHLGQELVACLEGKPFEIDQLEGVVSPGSTESEFEFRGELLDAHSKWPSLRKGDLVFVCTPSDVAGEVIRAALRAQAPCIDCSGSLSAEAGVLMPARRFPDAAGAEQAQQAAEAPLASLPSASLLAWVPIFDALRAGPGLSRVVATVLRSASAHGREGVVALSEESIAVFNQGDTPPVGPAGQPVAFDVVPGAREEERIVRESKRIFGEDLRLDVTTLEVPAFVGECASLALELGTPEEESALRARLEAIPGFQFAKQGPGSRGLVAIGSDDSDPSQAPMGPTLRDGVGQDDVIAGDLRPDVSLPGKHGWRLWLAYDPARLMARYAVHVAGQRFPDS